MRAPPELETVSSGVPRSIAESQARENFSPTALPIEPPMNEKSITASSTGWPSIVARPTTIASARPVLSSASASRSTYGRRSKKPSGSAERTSAASSTNLPGSASHSIRAQRRHREVVAAVRADVERRRELVVAVVRPAARAGVRVLLLAGRRLRVLDPDVDAGLGHGDRILDRLRDRLHVGAPQAGTSSSSVSAGRDEVGQLPRRLRARGARRAG